MGQIELTVLRKCLSEQGNNSIATGLRTPSLLARQEAKWGHCQPGRLQEPLEMMKNTFQEMWDHTSKVEAGLLCCVPSQNAAN